MALASVVLTVAASASALAYHRQVSRCPNPWHRDGGRCYSAAMLWLTAFRNSSLL